MRVGSRWKSVVSEAEVIVIRAGSKDAVLSCGGHPMVQTRPGSPQGEVSSDFTGETLIGKRYVDDELAIEVLSTKAGAGQLSVDDRVLTIKDSKALPTSD